MPNTTNTNNTNFTLADGTVIPTEFRTWLSVSDKGNCTFTLEPEWRSKLDAKEILWKDIPEAQRKAYAWRKSYFALQEASKNKEVADKLAADFKVLETALADNAAALLTLKDVQDIFKKLQKKATAKYSLMAKLFGKETAAIGDSIPFSMDIVADLAKLQAKGYGFELKDNRMVVTKVPAKA